jgi:hypothetical protein
MSEQRFWATYFTLVDDILERRGTSTHDNISDSCSQDPPRKTSPSGMSGWEEVARDDITESDSPPPAPADDLEDYLRVRTG